MLMACTTIVQSLRGLWLRKRVTQSIYYTISYWVIPIFQILMCLRANINLILMAIFKQLGLKPLELTLMWFLMVDLSMKKPIGILFGVIVRVDNFIFLADFVIQDCDVDTEMPIIIGIPFMATGRGMVDMEKGELKFRVNNEEAIFNILKSKKQLTDIRVVSVSIVLMTLEGNLISIL